MVVIGVVGEHGVSAVTEIIKGELKKQGNRVWKVSGLTNEENNDAVQADKKPDCVIVKLNNKRIKKLRLAPRIFDVIVFINHNNYLLNEESMDEMIKAVKEDGYFIYNSEELIDSNIENNNFFAISCGRNSRSTTTISSVDEVETMSFQYCLQRYLINYNKQLLEPFERNVNMLWQNIDEDYYLAAYTCIMVLGYKF